MTRDELAQWFRNLHGELRGFFLVRRVAAADTDDLVQEVFVNMLRYSIGEQVDNPRSYLFTTALRVLFDTRLIAVRRAKHWPLIRADVPRTDPSPEGLIGDEQVLARVREEVDRLPPRQRRLITLHMDEQLTYPQLAQALGITERMVLRDLRKAYETLRIALQSYRTYARGAHQQGDTEDAECERIAV